MSPRPAADDRVRRLLAMVPWVAAHDGPELAEVCRRFGCTEQQLLDDLDLLFVTGVHPFTPDTLIEVDVADGRVWIRYADWFARPLRLTPAEGLGLLAAGAALSGTPGADPDGPLASALAKLAAALGVDPEESVDVELGDAAPGILAIVQEAAAARRRVELDYYSYGRDVWSRRVLEPSRVFSSAGHWYAASQGRLFRVDRMREARVLDEAFEPPTEPASADVYMARADDPLIELELPAAAGWVVEQYPVESVAAGGKGRIRVRLRWSERAWLERLLLRVGAGGRVVEGDAAIGPAAARRLLGRYSVAPS